MLYVTHHKVHTKEGVSNILKKAIMPEKLKDCLDLIHVLCTLMFVDHFQCGEAAPYAA